MTSRRVFLKHGACALVSLGFAPTFLARTAQAATSRGRVLIAIFQRGAVDGLNMIVPFGERAYYTARPSIAIQAPGRDGGALDLDGFFGFHPRLAPLKPFYDAGHLAIVHASGSPDATRSHFDAQDYMETATPGVKRRIPAHDGAVILWATSVQRQRLGQRDLYACQPGVGPAGEFAQRRRAQQVEGHQAADRVAGQGEDQALPARVRHGGKGARLARLHAQAAKMDDADAIEQRLEQVEVAHRYAARCDQHICRFQPAPHSSFQRAGCVTGDT